ncbi:hypothetical protein DH2020_045684 [Rehmannia glutinosa]|uniref:peptidylprolyl isomerase n=1 Tax=Rehmannia glutinosa TaxID=99300 RepID=A0ABR0UDM4_REHGL
MAFWGIEVKPWKPITHSCEKSRGRLRISQATLGIGGATEKSIVQCNVGNRSPVLLCVLLPNQTESCHLDLEFEEADDVIFSVIGPRSVYLTGYYVCKSQPSNPQSDTHTEGSNSCSDDDKYEDSFIDDDELQVRSPSPVISSKVMDESTPENDKLKNRNGRGKRLKKKCQVVESDDDTNSRENEDEEDGYLLSIFKSKRAEKKTFTSAGEKIAQATVEMGDKSKYHGICTRKSEEKVDLVDINGKSRKKRKERPEEDKIFEVQIDKVYSVLGEDKKKEIEASANMEVGNHCLLPPPESGSGNGKRSKKRRKELQLEGTFAEGTDAKCDSVGKDNKFEQDLLHSDSVVNDMPAENRDQEQQIDNNVSIKPELLANASQPEKKTKKKKNKKTQGEGDFVLNLPNMTDYQENTFVKIENRTSNEKPNQNRTLSNGLIIEDVANGPPDGKVAAPGKKVRIYYTAMLKENGHIIDSNVGKSACKFRLGDEGIIDGWNLGIDGMHVGDKRRLIVPPSMCFGKHGASENVPPNSWLVYDVELVGVRK